MWFVWDGRTRLGPHSEDEICRRVLHGEWSLSIYVRPEDSTIYRPLVWMLPRWTSPRRENELERTIVRGSTPMHEATQIAPLNFVAQLNQSGVDKLPANHAKAVEAEIGLFEVPSERQSPPSPPSPPPPAPPSPPPARPAPPSPPPEPEGGRAVAPGDFDFLTTELAGPREGRQTIRFEQLSKAEAASGEIITVAPFSLTPASLSSRGASNSAATKSPVAFGPNGGGVHENSVVRAAQAAIAEGERLSRAFERREQQSGQGEGEAEQSFAVNLPRNGNASFGRSSVQSPARASEGSVRLVDQESATQIKFRRVNPTAPRRQQRTGAQRFVQRFGLAAFSRGLGRGLSRRPSSSSSMTVFVLVGVLAAVVVAGAIYLFSVRKGRPNFTPNEQAIFEKPESRPNRGVRKPRNPQNNIAEKETNKKKKSMSARDPEAAAPKSKIFSSASELQAYMRRSGERGFIVIGPMTIKQRPSKGCEPCLGSAQLPDGTIINLSSVMHQPWRTVSKSNVIYARGILIGSGRMTLTVNALSRNPL